MTALALATFISANPTHAISHPLIKEAAGNEQFVARFNPHPEDPSIGVFETSETRVSDAITTLIQRGNLVGVQNVTNPTAPIGDFLPRTPVGTEGLPPVTDPGAPTGNPGGDGATPAGNTPVNQVAAEIGAKTARDAIAAIAELTDREALAALAQDDRKTVALAASDRLAALPPVTDPGAPTGNPGGDGATP